MIGVAQAAQLPLQKHGFALLEGLVQVQRGIDHHGTDALAQRLYVRNERLQVNRRLMVQVFQGDVLLLDRASKALAQDFIVINLAYLDADFQVFIAIEGRDAALGGAKAGLAQAFFLKTVKIHVIGQHNLRAVGNVQLGVGHAARHHAVIFVKQLFNIQSHARADDVGDILMKHA